MANLYITQLKKDGVMMNDIQKAQMQFLNDTKKHFNKNNLGVAENGWCKYSEGCAIGRHLDKNLAIDLDSHGDILNIKLNHLEYYDLIPKSLKELGIEFLKDIQELHDCTFNWNYSGLSESGQIHYDYIKHKIERNAYEI